MKNISSPLLKTAALLTMLVAHTAFGWDLGIANYTKAVVDIEVTYVWSSCRKDNRTIQPGQIIHVNAKACLVDDITGFAKINGKRIALTKASYGGTIGGRDFSINIEEIGSDPANKTYRIERVR